MAKRRKPLNAARRLKALKDVPKTRNPVALAMILRGGVTRHSDGKKKADRNACRGRHVHD